MTLNARVVCLAGTPLFMVGIITLSMVGCSGSSQDGESSAGNQGQSTKQADQLTEDKKSIEQSIRERHPGATTKITKWHEHVPYYAALEGAVGREGYSGLSLVDNREEALESVKETNEMMRNLNSPGEELIEFELKKLESIGFKIKVEYEAGSGSNRTHYRDNYLVMDSVSLLNGKLVKEGRGVILNGSTSISADSTIRSGTSN